MRAAKILLSWLVGGLIIGGLIWYLPSKLFPKYTAQTFIRVLPVSQSGALPGPRTQPLNLPGAYSASVVALIKSQNTLESLVNSDKLQQTGWFMRLAATQDGRITAAVSELKKHLNAEARPGSDLVAVSMTCRDGKDAADVLNEIVDLFLKRRQAAERKLIITDLSRLEEQQVRIQRDLDLAEMTLDGVRIRYGFSDLEQHSYPDPITTRLIKLQRQEDDYTIEIKQLQTHLGELSVQPQVSSSGNTDTNSADKVKDIQFRVKLLQSELTELKKMREEAEKQYNELNRARAQYAQRLAIRDERRQALDSVKARSEGLKMLHEDPDACGMQFVEDATAPRQADMWPWQTIIPTAAIAAVIAGIVHLLLTKRASKTSS